MNKNISNEALTVKVIGTPLCSTINSKDLTDIYKRLGIEGVLETISKDGNGSWGITIQDADTVFAFTDPHGIEQLYYRTDPDVMVSESIWDLYTSADIDRRYMSEILKWGYNTDDRTPWNNIKRVMPGELIQINPINGEVIKKSIFLRYFTDNSSYTNLAEELRNRVHNAVIARIKSLPKNENNIAMLLSGGLDSSCIAYELIQAQKNGLLKDKNIKFYTINNADDAPFVKDFAKMFNIDVTVLSYSMDNIDLRKHLFINEMPIDLGSMIPNQKMFEAIPENIIFTGDGPDEMLGGYNRIDQYDSQLSDTFEELPFYHFPRLTKAARFYNKSLICPYTDRNIVSFALSIPFSERTHKKILKDAYKGLIPESIIQRPKLPLKNDEIRKDPMSYRYKIVEVFTNSVRR